MKYVLPANSMYGNKPVIVDIPDSWEISIHSYRGETAKSLTKKEIHDMVVHKAKIAEKSKGCKDAVIIIDDITRPTPVQDIAESVIAELTKNIPPEKIRFVAAVGMHRAMSREDFVRKLGNRLVQEFRTFSHNPFFNTIQVGICSAGFPVELNAECVRADFKVGIGAIFGHANTGISGGGKLIVPGIASLETARRYHLHPMQRWNLSLKARQITLEAAEMLGLNCKIDVLLNGKGEISQLFAGTCRENIEENIKEIFEFFRTAKPEPADVVIANNYFKPSEPDVVLSYPEFFNFIIPGGALIVSSHSPMGAATHYLFGRWGDSGIGGVSYHGNRCIPGSIGRYFAFSTYLDKGTALQYHYDPTDPRFCWTDSWNTIMKTLGNEARKVLILPYATVPYFSPPLAEDAVPLLNIGPDSYKQRDCRVEHK
jgi:hypothetical protein